MIRIDHPVAIAMVLALLLVGVVVVPYTHSRPIRLSASKVLAVVVVISYCLFQRSVLPAVVLLWPLSFIFFPRYWGNFTGFINGPYIDKGSPPVVVAVFGWLFLIGYPIVAIWLSNL